MSVRKRISAAYVAWSAPPKKDNPMNVKDLFENANKLRGIDAFSLDENNTCSIMVGSDLAVHLVYFEKTKEILTFAIVGVEPTEGKAIIYQAVLNAMFMFRGTQGSTISLDDETHQFYLSRRDRLAVFDAEAFLAMIDVFAEVACKWRKTLLEFSPIAIEAERDAEKGLNAFRNAYVDNNALLI